MAALNFMFLELAYTNVRNGLKM